MGKRCAFDDKTELSPEELAESRQPAFEEHVRKKLLQTKYLWNLRNECLCRSDRVSGILRPLTTFQQMSWIKATTISAKAPEDFELVATDAVARRLLAQLATEINNGEIPVARVDPVVEEWKSYEVPSEPVTLPMSGIDDALTRRILTELTQRCVCEIYLRGKGITCAWMDESFLLIGDIGCGKSSFFPNLLGGRNGLHYKLTSSFHATSNYDIYAQAHALSWELSELAVLMGKLETATTVSDLLTHHSHESRESLTKDGDGVSRDRLHIIYGTHNHPQCIRDDVRGLDRRLIPVELDKVSLPNGQAMYQWLLRNRQPIIAGALKMAVDCLAEGRDPEALFATFYGDPAFSQYRIPYIKRMNPAPSTWEEVLAGKPVLEIQPIRLDNAKRLMGLKDNATTANALVAAGWQDRREPVQGQRVRYWYGPSLDRSLLPILLDRVSAEVDVEPLPNPSPFSDHPDDIGDFSLWVSGRDEPVRVRIPNKTPRHQFFIPGILPSDAPLERVGAVPDDEVQLMHSAFWEWDKDLDVEEQLNYWYPHHLLNPTVQLVTGNRSVHCYLRFEEPIEAPRVVALMSNLSKILDSDSTIKNSGQVMRLPGFEHETTGNCSAWRTTGHQALSLAQFEVLEQWLKDQVGGAEPLQGVKHPVLARRDFKDGDPQGLLYEMLSFIPASPPAKNGTYELYRNLCFGIAGYCDKHGLPRELGIQAVKQHSPARAEPLAECVRVGNGKRGSGTLVRMAKEGGWRPKAMQ